MDQVAETDPAAGLSLVLVEDHRLFRDGLKTLLEARGHHVVGVAATGGEGLRLAFEHRPDVVILDLDLKGESGIGLIEQLVPALSSTHVLVMTGSDVPDAVVEALLAGADGYLVKEIPFEEMVDGVEAVARGEKVISGRGTRMLIDRLRELSAAEDAPAPTEDDGFSERERAILRLLVDGCDNASIAEALNLSVGSIKAQVSALCHRLGASNRVQVAVAAVRRGLV